MQKLAFLYKQIWIKLFFLPVCCIIFFSCKSPLATKNNDYITINFPNYESIDKNFPNLTKWKITTTNQFGQKTYFAPPEQKSISINLEKDYLCSILVYPITQQEFFFPAGCVYPTDFFTQPSSAASFKNGIYSKIVESVLYDKRYSEKKHIINYFNFEKLKTTLQKNEDNFFESFSESKYKEWADSKLSYDVDIDDVIEKIFNPEQKFSVKYKKTKIFSLNNANTILHSNLEKTFCIYIPLNNLKNKKSYVTINQDFLNSSIAFFINDRILYLSPKDL